MSTFRGVRRIGPYDHVGGFAPGECPHALRKWRTVTLPSGREHYVPVELPCHTDHRGQAPISAGGHVTAFGDRWS